MSHLSKNESSLRIIKRSELNNVMDRTRAAGMKLISAASLEALPCENLYPLGLAMLEAAALYRMFDESSGYRDLSFLFDGGERNGPNLYSRLCCIRDLCKAAQYGAEKRAYRDEDDKEKKKDIDEKKKLPSLGEKALMDLFKPHLGDVDEQTGKESPSPQIPRFRCRHVNIPSTSYSSQDVII